MRKSTKSRVWVGLVSILLILSLAFAGCGEEKEKESTVTGVSPSSGKAGETLSVNVVGTELTGASAVDFGSGITVNSFNVDSATQISVSITIAATATSGSRTVSVTTPAGIATKTGAFTVAEPPPPPTVTGVSPGSGKVGHSVDVTITGTGLIGASAVSFGTGITVDSFTVDSATKIAATISIADTATTGARDVSVTAPTGTGTGTGVFTVSGLQAPTVTAVSPNTGEWGETLDVTITGTNFINVGWVSFGPQITIDSYTVDSATRISATITIGAEKTGAMDVTVGNPDGPDTLAGGFTVTGPPFKIGVIFPLTGSLADAGEEGLEGVEMYLEEIGYEVAGREIQIIVEDTEGSGPVALEKVMKLVEHDQVEVLTGIVSSGTAIALRTYVTEEEIPLVLGMSGSTTLCYKMPSPYIVNVAHINGDHTYVGVRYCYETLGYRKAVMMYSDYAAGQEYAMVFRNAWEAMGGTIVDEIPTPPFITTDFSPYLTTLVDMDADFVWTFYADREAIAFINQFHDFGLDEKMALVGGQGGMTTPAVLEATGENAIGIYVGCHTPPFGALPGRPASEAFAAAFEAKYADYAGPMAYTGYQQAYCIAKTVEALEGDTSDKAAFVDALTDLHFEGKASPISFDKDYRWVITNGYFFQVVEQDGGLGFELLATYEAIGPRDMAAYVD